MPTRRRLEWPRSAAAPATDRQLAPRQRASPAHTRLRSAREATSGRPVCPSEALLITAMIMVPIAPVPKACEAVAVETTPVKAAAALKMSPTTIQAYARCSTQTIGSLRVAKPRQSMSRAPLRAAAISAAAPRSASEPPPASRRTNTTIEMIDAASSHAKRRGIWPDTPLRCSQLCVKAGMIRPPMMAIIMTTKSTPMRLAAEGSIATKARM